MADFLPVPSQFPLPKLAPLTLWPAPLPISGDLKFNKGLGAIARIEGD